MTHENLIRLLTRFRHGDLSIDDTVGMLKKVPFQVLGFAKVDHHSGIREALPARCAAVDQPIAALLADLKQRGLLQDTLVLWGGEFGRTPTAEGTNGREHHPFGFTMWLAGGGIRGGSERFDPCRVLARTDPLDTT